MMQFTKGQKISAVRRGILASLAVTACLLASSAVSADPGKYRNRQVKGIIVLAAVDDFRAPPTKFESDVTATASVTSDDFRAPPADPIETASTGSVKNCTRATYKTCIRMH